MARIGLTNLPLATKGPIVSSTSLRKDRIMEVTIMVSSSYMKLLPKTMLSSDTDNEVKESEEINGEQGRDESWQNVMQKK